MSKGHDEDLDRDDNNPNEMTQEEWAEFYADEERMGMSFDEYLDNDHNMDY